MGGSSASHGAHPYRSRSKKRSVGARGALPLYSQRPHSAGRTTRADWEHRPDIPPTEQPQDASFPVTSLLHDLMVVMSPDCDLEWDYFLRFPKPEHAAGYQPAPGIESQSKYLPHVLLCDAHPDEELLAMPGMNKGIWRNVISNQDQRYHHLPSGPVGNPHVSPLPDLVLDFKKPLTIPTSMLYKVAPVQGPAARRRTADLSPRSDPTLLRILSRVALPD